MLGRVVALLAFALLAGCLEKAAPVGEVPDQGIDELGSAPTERMSRQDGDSPGESFDLVLAETPTDLSAITELHWASSASLERFVLEIQLDFGEANDCELLRGSAARTSEPGPVAVTIFEMPLGVGWSVSSRGSGLGYANVHAGPVDTRTLLGSDGHSASLHGSGGTFSGPLRFTFIARDLQGWDNSFMPAEHSAAVSLTCDKPFAVVEARRGQAALMADSYNLAGGAGADAFVVGSANVGDQASLDIPSPFVRAGAAGFGIHGGQVVLDHPAGSETWTVLPDYVVATGEPGFFIDTAPGPHTFAVDHAGAYFEALWVAAWGMDGPFDLQAELLPESVLDSPFD